MLMITAVTANPTKPLWTQATMMINLLQNPLNGGMPAIDMEATSVVALVTGIARFKPPSCFKSRVPVTYSTVPALRNSSDLTTAWLSR